MTTPALLPSAPHWTARTAEPSHAAPGRVPVRSALQAHQEDARAARPTVATCQHDSGAATDCRPLCDAPATVATDHRGVRELLTSAHCARHHRSFLASLYPSLPAAVRPL